MEEEYLNDMREVSIPDTFQDYVLTEVVEEFSYYGLYEDVVNETLRSLKIYE